jgi:hypothetical protein
MKLCSFEVICGVLILKPAKQVLHIQAKDLIFKMFGYFKCEADTGGPLCDDPKYHEHNSLCMWCRTQDSATL